MVPFQHLSQRLLHLRITLLKNLKGQSLKTIFILKTAMKMMIVSELRTHHISRT